MNGENGAPRERKETLVENPKMQFILRGFSQVVALRVFAFEGIAADRTRALFTVSADLALARRYRIRLQELPLLCRSVLERVTKAERNGRLHTPKRRCASTPIAQQRGNKRQNTGNRRAGLPPTTLEPTDEFLHGSRPRLVRPGRKQNG